MKMWGSGPKFALRTLTRKESAEKSHLWNGPGLRADKGWTSLLLRKDHLGPLSR